MARPNSDAKAGYYPLSAEHLPGLASLITPGPGKILDPCAGEGTALQHLAAAWTLTPYANELNHDRAASCRDKFGALNAVQGDLRELRASRYAFSVLYCNPPYSHDATAYKLTAEGWPYRSREGTPRRFNREDIRRVIANWPEYGGIVSDTRSKDRAGYEDIDLDEIPFKPERAVFPIELLAKVAHTRQQRSIEPKDMGVKRKSVPYPLSVMTYCAHCERLAIKQDNMSLRSKLYGYTGPDDIKRYRHKAGINCGCTNRLVHAEVYERDFHRLIELLDVDEAHLDSMTDMALELDRVLGIEYDTIDLEEKKREAIALCRKKIDAAVVLFGEGRIELADYQRRIEENEREIRYWEAKTSEVEKINVELSMALEIVQHMAQLWHTSGPEDRKGMAQNLFDSLTYDLDTQRITAFRLKPWADRFMVLRAQLYDGFDVRQVNWKDFKGSSNHMPPRGFEYPPLPSVEKLDQLFYLLDHQEALLRYQLQQLYTDQEVIHYHPQRQKTNRNALILAQYG